MKTFLLLTIQFFVVIFSTFAQTSLSIKYSCTYNLGSTLQKEAELLVSGSKSMFKYLNPVTSSLIKSDEKEENGTKTLSLSMTLSDSTGIRYFSNLQQNEIVSREILLQEGKNKVFIIKEKIEPIRWQVKNEQRKIGRFICQKAVGKFRGRTYTAWFTTEVPINVGPWKLHGLPGLVVEVADEEKALMIQIKSITPILIASNSLQPPTDGQEKSFTEYFSMIQNLGSDFQKFVQAKLPRGTTFEVTSVSRNTLELTEVTNE